MNSRLTFEFQPVSQGQDFQIVKFIGEFDKAGFSEIKDSLTDAIKAFELKTLILDFQNLKFINSEGIGFLMEVHTHLIQRDRKLIIVGSNAHVKDVFAAIGMAEIVPMFDSTNDYLNSAK